MITFTSSRQDTLRIEGNKITVTNKFDDTYTGYVNENGYVVTKSSLGLGYLDRARKEYKNSINL